MAPTMFHSIHNRPKQRLNPILEFALLHGFKERWLPYIKDVL